ncbi:MAG: CPBP family intramembrane metalloprotease [Phycisphaeraceae bacterium]|nr:MAG: CPBP family intramembrane metalloprotease [Phycisphaeraceae bacterium]
MTLPIPERQPADPGTPFSRKVALIAAILLGGLLITMQNREAVVSLFRGTTPAAQAQGGEAQAAPPSIQPPTPAEPFTLSARFAVQTQDMPEWFTGAPQDIMPVLDAWAMNDADRVRAAIVAGELVGPEEAVERLEKIDGLLKDNDPLKQDADDLIRIYRGDATSAALDDATRERLREHHGFFGEVALSYGLPDSDPARAPLISGGAKLVGLLLGIGIGVALLFLTGCVLFIVGFVMVMTGKIRPRFPRPEPGGSVFLETYALFAGAFLVLSLGLDLVGYVLPEAAWLLHVQIALQWLLLAVPLWPLMRGMSLERLAGTIGWHKGEGVLKEMGCGVLGYLAGLPLLAGGMALSMMLVFIVQGVRRMAGLGEPPPPDSAIFDLLGTHNTLVLVLFFLLATVWAPVVEESIFRGALYRHLRTRFGVPVAAVSVAFLFGLSHNYGPILVFPVVMLGLMFCIMREWRGSLIASMTAHAMHNATVSVMAFFVLRMIS